MLKTMSNTGFDNTGFGIDNALTEIERRPKEVETVARKILYSVVQVIVTSYRSGEVEVYVKRALAAGARAYLAKDNLATDLIPAVAAAIGIPPATDRGTS